MPVACVGTHSRVNLLSVVMEKLIAVAVEVFIRRGREKDGIVMKALYVRVGT